MALGLGDAEDEALVAGIALTGGAVKPRLSNRHPNDFLERGLALHQTLYRVNAEVLKISLEEMIAQKRCIGAARPDEMPERFIYHHNLVNGRATVVASFVTMCATTPTHQLLGRINAKQIVQHDGFIRRHAVVFATPGADFPHKALSNDADQRGADKRAFDADIDETCDGLDRGVRVQR